jgi:hypothetical protein
MNLTKNETANKILGWVCAGFFGAFGLGLGLLVIRSVDALKPLAWG